MTAPAVLYAPPRRLVVDPPVLNVDGEDIRQMLEAAAAEAELPLELLLACAIAESGLNPRAERWGSLTALAKQAIAAGDMAWLRGIVRTEWPDISFGYSQRIVLYHWAGNHLATVENCLAVRATVFGDPARDLVEMANHLAVNLLVASSEPSWNLAPVDGDASLGALVIYNAGHLPYPGDPWWKRWAGNVNAYRAALAQVRALLGKGA